MNQLRQLLGSLTGGWQAEIAANDRYGVALADPGQMRH